MTKKNLPSAGVLQFSVNLLSTVEVPNLCCFVKHAVGVIE